MVTRRTFIKQSLIGAGSLLVLNDVKALTKAKKRRPNLIYVFADQWRAQDAGYAGNKDVLTPHIDRLAAESLRFRNAVSCIPVSTPYRGALLTGQYALTNGLFVNDVPLNPEAVTIGKSYKAAGYDTAYIGKWHINGNGRNNYIPKSNRQGFEYFKVLECTHKYNQSNYYDNEDEHLKTWEGYDALDQTRDAQAYIRQHATKDKPFMMVLSWGPPHNPYDAAPEEYRNLYKDKELTLRANVPEHKREETLRQLRGYYAHISALDACVGMLQKTIQDAGIEEDTIFVLSSDHGDMLGSQGEKVKQRPWDESICVPFLLKYPQKFGRKGKTVGTLISTPDIMPTLLSISDIPIPNTVEGKDLHPILTGKKTDDTDAALIACVVPFGGWSRDKGGKEYRGIRTHRYTFVRDLSGPWLLYDNQTDPYQLNNLVGKADYADLQTNLDTLLSRKLTERKDEFLPGDAYLKKWGYKNKGNAE